MAIRVGTAPKSEETPAARLNDKHVCPKHGGGGPISSASPNVTVNGVRFARATDKCSCSGPTDYIVTGSGTVRVNGKPAARIKSKTMHHGQVTQGSNNVLVGGPDAGCTLGNPDQAKKDCETLSKSRVSGGPAQSYGNCGIESSRLLMQQANGSSPSEFNLLQQSINANEAQYPANATNAQIGGTTYLDRQAILSNNGVTTTALDPTQDNLTQSVADGDGVISSHDAGKLWGMNVQGGHAIVPSGLEYDANGDLTAVDTVDSGLGNCKRQVPANQFFNSMNSPSTGAKLNVTSKPIF